MGDSPKRFRPIMQPVVHEESKRQKQRRLDWEERSPALRGSTALKPAKRGLNFVSGAGILVGFGIVAGIAWLGYSLTTREPETTPTITKQEAAAKVDDSPEEEAGRFSRFFEYGELKGKVHEAARRFLEADSLEELEKWVTEKEKVIPRMRDYYRDAPPEPTEVRAVRLSLKYETPEEKPEFYLVNVRAEGGLDIPLGVEVGPEGALVDWESHVGYNPVSIEDLGDGKENSRTFRAIMRKALFFDDRRLFESVAGEKGMVMELDLSGREEKVFAFAPESLESASTLQELAKSKRDQAVMLGLHGHPLLPDHYLIVGSFIQRGWVDRKAREKKADDEEAAKS